MAVAAILEQFNAVGSLICPAESGSPIEGAALRAEEAGLGEDRIGVASQAGADDLNLAVERGHDKTIVIGVGERLMHVPD